MESYQMDAFPQNRRHSTGNEFCRPKFRSVKQWLADIVKEQYQDTMRSIAHRMP